MRHYINYNVVIRPFTQDSTYIENIKLTLTPEPENYIIIYK
jgi:hypothetical protein